MRGKPGCLVTAAARRQEYRAEIIVRLAGPFALVTEIGYMDPVCCKVSVCAITYNHERFIAQAVESVMMQETTFAYEMVIGEDCSTDRTREILIRLRDRYPDRLCLLLHDRNLGASQNFAAVLAACTGEYVAFLDGDDYFTSNQKLQSQIDFLDSDPRMTICAHRHADLYESGELRQLVNSPKQKEVWTFRDFLRGYSMHPSTVVARRAVIDELPDWFHGAQSGDVALQFMCVQNGLGGFINEVMSVYRLHGGGKWSSQEPLEVVEGAISLWRELAKHVNRRSRATVERRIARLLISRSRLQRLDGDELGARQSLGESIHRAPSVVLRSITPLRLLLQLRAPGLYRMLRRVREGLRATLAGMRRQ